MINTDITDKAVSLPESLHEAAAIMHRGAQELVWGFYLLDNAVDDETAEYARQCIAKAQGKCDVARRYGILSSRP